ncbi:MAG: hypothetical protein E7L17_08180 [Clostridium sp.]|uniref:hypothetical protein n=1 Tax=Clostridium sp. TaxID=1506 RepID=UPI00290D4CE4|nr:hypothetical protein [Clostridium sp.]MDU7338076.1 hypothetical protein [Clostridium sp.]
MDNPSLKKNIVSHMYSSLFSEFLESNSLILLTPMGVIKGKPVDVKEALDKVSKNTDFSKLSSSEISCGAIAQLTENAADEYQKEFSISFPLKGNDGYIILKNVTFDNSNKSYNLPALVVFFDQIIGITIANI